MELSENQLECLVIEYLIERTTKCIEFNINKTCETLCKIDFEMKI